MSQMALGLPLPDTYPSTDKQDQTAFRFLDLHPELRDMVYAEIMKEYPPVLRRCKALSSVHTKPPLSKGRRKTSTRHRSGVTSVKVPQLELFSKSPLSRASRQTRHEFLSLAAISSSTLHLEIINFDFGPAISWLNSLSEVQMNKLISRNGIKAERSIIVDLLVVNAAPKNFFFHQENSNRLGRWLGRFDVTDKKGVRIDFQYELHIEPFDWYVYDDSRCLYRKLKLDYKSNKANDERDKIEGAFRKVIASIPRGVASNAWWRGGFWLRL